MMKPEAIMNPMLVLKLDECAGLLFQTAEPYPDESIGLRLNHIGDLMASILDHSLNFIDPPI